MDNIPTVEFSISINHIVQYQTEYLRHTLLVVSGSISYANCRQVHFGLGFIVVNSLVYSGENKARTACPFPDLEDYNSKRAEPFVCLG